MAASSTNVRNTVHDSLTRLGYISSERRRQEHDSANDPLLRFALEDRETDAMIRNHILTTTLDLWLNLDYSMEAAEQTMRLIDRMYRDPSYRVLFTTVDIERTERARELITEWRKSNPPEEVIVEPVHLRGDPYEVLGISKDASSEQIRDAYRRLVKEHHPDHNNNSAESNAKFKEIQEAYDTLQGPNPHP